jgi:enoyl-CoA hydratase
MSEVLTRYEEPAPGVARIVLARADKHNALNPALIFAINEDFTRALNDDSIKVIVLAADGRNFSAGHDIAETVEQYQQAMQDSSPGVSGWSGFNEPGAHGWYASEKEGYLESARRIRNIAKPTICAVQGKCIAGALIYPWVCDIIVAAENATFSDPVINFGMPAVEWLGHPWELGPRKAKEFLFTADTWNAEEAHRLGMVNHVVPLDQLEAFTLAMAEKIAKKPAFALKLAKEAVNKTLDIQGQMNAIDQAFSLHHLGHQHNFRLFGYGMDTTNLPGMASAPKKPK